MKKERIIGILLCIGGALFTGITELKSGLEDMKRDEEFNKLTDRVTKLEKEEES